MIPKDVGSLPVCLAQCFHNVVLLQSIHITQKKSIEMSGWHGATYFTSFYYNDSTTQGLTFGILEGQVQVSFLHAFTGGLSLYVVAQGNGIKTFFPCLVDTK